MEGLDDELPRVRGIGPRVVIVLGVRHPEVRTFLVEELRRHEPSVVDVRLGGVVRGFLGPRRQEVDTRGAMDRNIKLVLRSKW